MTIGLAFNGIQGNLSQPGQIPWEIVVVYFLAAAAFAVFYGRRGGGLRSFTTLDLVYIGIGAAFAVVWEFFIGSFLGAFVPRGLATFINIGYLGGQLFTTLVVAALVRKVGVGMMTFFIYSLLADLFHYGFGGEPIYFIYEALTYGLFIDLMIAITGGNLFAVKTSAAASISDAEEEAGPAGASSSIVAVSKSILPPTVAMILEGAVIGWLFSFPDPLFYAGFFAPFLYGGTVNWQRIIFLMEAFAPSGIIVGAFAGMAGNRIARAIGQ